MAPRVSDQRLWLVLEDTSLGKKKLVFNNEADETYHFLSVYNTPNAVYPISP